MIKDIMAANEEATPNRHEIEILKETFPSCFHEDGSFDIDRFKGFLSDKINVTGEGYELKFLGKNYARLLASVETTTVVVPDEEHNVNEEHKKSENVYISGDNLDGLKHILKSYSNKVKCIYIDPPYNTGSDGFVYNDSFSFSVEDLSIKLSIDEEQAKRILDLTKRGSASHSAWLMFMYPRLLLARDLLMDDGVIFISIDDNEQANLKLICDDIFGEETFQGMFIINASPSAIDYGSVAKMHEYALMYAKNIDSLSTNKLVEKNKEFTFTDSKGGFDIYPLYNGNVAFNPTTRPNLYYPFYVNPNHELDNGFFEIGLEPQDGWIEVYPVVSKKDGIPRVWRWGKEEKSRKNLNGDIVGYLNKDGEYRIVQKYRSDEKTIRSLLMDNSMSSRRGTAEVQELFEKKVFSFPKPINLVKQFLLTGMDDDSYVVDFFSGSATTAHAVMQMNACDGGNRKYIMVQIQEKVGTGSEAEKIGYSTIDQIGMERIKRAAKKIREEYPYTTADLGFKHYTLREPSEETLDKLESFTPEDNETMFIRNNVFEDFGRSTVLATWLLRDGYGFTAQVKELDLAGYKGYYMDKHLYLIDAGLIREAIEALAVKYETDGAFNPENIVVFGYNFTWTELDSLQINLKRLKDTEKNLRINFDIRY